MDIVWDEIHLWGAYSRCSSECGSEFAGMRAELSRQTCGRGGQRGSRPCVDPAEAVPCPRTNGIRPVYKQVSTKREAMGVVV